MFPSPRIRADRAPIVVACLGILGFVLAACGTTSPSSLAATSPVESSTPSASTPPAETNQSQTIHVLEPAKNVTQVSVGSLTGCTDTAGCQGDYVLGDDPLLDATSKQEVGRLLFECFRVDTASTLFHCPGNTIILTGRGQIVFTEDVHFAPGYTLDQWPVTGGSGEFLGATGFVTSPADSTYSEGGDFLITID